MEKIVRLALELTVRHYAAYLKDWIRSKNDLDLEPSLENEICRVIDDSLEMFVSEMED